MNQWVATGKSKSTVKKNLRVSYIKGNMDRLTQVLVRLQMAVVEDQLNVYVAIMKKNDENFMLVSQTGEIEGYGSSFNNLYNKEGGRYEINGLTPNYPTLLEGLDGFEPITVKTDLQPFRQVPMTQGVYYSATLEMWKEQFSTTWVVIIRALSLE